MSSVGISYLEVNFNGLRKKPSYEELVRYIANDKDKIKYPDSRASFLRKHTYLTQLDGESMATIEQQQLEAIRELQKINNLNMFAIENGLTRAEAMGIYTRKPRRIRAEAPISTTTVRSSTKYGICSTSTI